MKTFFQMRDKTMKGGPGSGFHNHAGRPGKVGGSQKETEEEYQITSFDRNLVERASEENANTFTSKEKNRLSAIIQKQKPLTRDTVFYRGVSSEDIRFPGDKWNSDQFVSLSTSKHVAQQYGDRVITVKVPKGTKVFLYSNYGYWGQDEAILDIGTKFIADSNSRWNVFQKSIEFEKAISWRPWSIFENNFIAAIFNALVEQLQLLIGWDDIANVGVDSSFWIQLDNLLNRNVLPLVQQIAQKAVKDTVGSIAMTVSYEMTSMAASEWALLYSSAQITKVNETTKKAVRTAISEWIASGENGGIQQLRKLLAELKDENGQPLFDEARAKRIAQSELTSIYAGAKAKALEANGYRHAVFLPRAHTNCRCYIQPATAPDGTKVIVWYTARDEMVCAREIETPFGTVKGCRELHRTIVSEGYAGQKFESNQWNPEEAQQ